jgi:uncharacterized membrane protein YhaH (DUF805 family)
MNGYRYAGVVSLADESKPVQDSEKGRPPGPGREAGNAGNGAGKSSFTSFAELSALVVIFGVSIYVLGLFAVWVPITLTYTHDFSTAWYAVSLVPQPTMAGFGVRQLLYPLLITILVLIVIGVSSSLSSIGSATGRASEDQSDPDQAKRRSRAVAWMWFIHIMSWPTIAYVVYRIVTNPDPLLQAPWLFTISAIFLVISMVLIVLVGVISAVSSIYRRFTGTSRRELFAGCGLRAFIGALTV